METFEHFRLFRTTFSRCNATTDHKLTMFTYYYVIHESTKLRIAESLAGDLLRVLVGLSSVSALNY